jgi:transposase-like protein
MRIQVYASRGGNGMRAAEVNCPECGSYLGTTRSKTGNVSIHNCAACQKTWAVRVAVGGHHGATLDIEQHTAY